MSIGTLADAPHQDPDAKRLAHRIGVNRDHLFTFLDEPSIPFENDFAERQIRPAVILRKHQQGNRSQQGVATQAILMSPDVHRGTPRLRGLAPTELIADALRAYLVTGQLPPLPQPTIADG